MKKIALKVGLKDNATEAEIIEAIDGINKDHLEAIGKLGTDHKGDLEKQKGESDKELEKVNGDHKKEVDGLKGEIGNLKLEVATAGKKRALKTMPEKGLKAKVARAFKANPEFEKIYAAEDGALFQDPGAASNHRDKLGGVIKTFRK